MKYEQRTKVLACRFRCCCWSATSSIHHSSIIQLIKHSIPYALFHPYQKTLLIIKQARLYQSNNIIETQCNNNCWLITKSQIHGHFFLDFFSIRETLDTLFMWTTARTTLFYNYMQLRYALLDVPFAQKIRAEGTIRKTGVLLVRFFAWVDVPEFLGQAVIFLNDNLTWFLLHFNTCTRQTQEALIRIICFIPRVLL